MLATHRSDLGGGGETVDHRPCDQREQRREHQRDAEPAPQHCADIARETFAVARPQPLAIEHLRGVLEAVEQQRGDHEQLVENAIGGQRHHAAFGAQPGERRQRHHQHHGAQKQVAIDREEGAQLGPAQVSALQQRSPQCLARGTGEDECADRCQLGDFCDKA